MPKLDGPVQLWIMSDPWGLTECTRPVESMCNFWAIVAVVAGYFMPYFTVFTY